MVKLLILPILLIVTILIFRKLMNSFNTNDETKSKVKSSIENSLKTYFKKEFESENEQGTIDENYKNLVINLANESFDIFLNDKEGFSKSVKNPNTKFTFVITDDKDYPFQINDSIISIVERIVLGKDTAYEKVKAIFEWFNDNVEYGDSKRRNNGYRNSSEVFIDKQGVCGELGVLFVVMARYCNIKANYVSVTVDNEGKKVYHACVNVTIGAENILIDPAYKEFGIMHKEYIIKNDETAIIHLKQWRRSKR